MAGKTYAVTGVVFTTHRSRRQPQRSYVSHPPLAANANCSQGENISTTYQKITSRLRKKKSTVCGRNEAKPLETRRSTEMAPGLMMEEPLPKNQEQIDGTGSYLTKKIIEWNDRRQQVNRGLNEFVEIQIGKGGP